MTQTIWTTRRVLWTAGVGFAGFILGTGAGSVGSGLSVLWGGAIGYGKSVPQNGLSHIGRARWP
jgi:hypothetical protein